MHFNSNVLFLLLLLILFHNQKISLHGPTNYLSKNKYKFVSKVLIPCNYFLVNFKIKFISIDKQKGSTLIWIHFNKLCYGFIKSLMKIDYIAIHVL